MFYDIKMVNFIISMHVCVCVCVCVCMYSASVAIHLYLHSSVKFETSETGKKVELESHGKYVYVCVLCVRVCVCFSLFNNLHQLSVVRSVSVVRLSLCKRIS